ncbi:MAG: hypothetical protein JWL62_716 [Hyphomicrobiales bacterium]|nr:hypothetical protein [Hyphomicrobiales bacterium]
MPSPTVPAQPAFGGGELAHGVEQQAHGGVGGFFRQHVGRVGDDNAVLRGPGSVDGVVADTEIGNEFDRWKLREEGTVDAQCAAVGQDARAGHDGANARCD